MISTALPLQHMQRHHLSLFTATPMPSPPWTPAATFSPSLPSPLPGSSTSQAGFCLRAFALQIPLSNLHLGCAGSENSHGDPSFRSFLKHHPLREDVLDYSTGHSSHLSTFLIIFTLSEVVLKYQYFTYLLFFFTFYSFLNIFY